MARDLLFLKILKDTIRHKKKAKGHKNAQK